MKNNKQKSEKKKKEEEGIHFTQHPSFPSFHNILSFSVPSSFFLSVYDSLIFVFGRKK
jgi:hypothetical protein